MNRRRVWEWVALLVLCFVVVPAFLLLAERLR